jgi:8-hydroxy-5-deazaflavin:NADPH oxidoreductase
MRVAVLGTGTVGRTIAGKLTDVGHDVRVGSRTAGDDKVTFADAAAHGEVIFSCTNGAASVEAVSACGEENMAGKLVIDVSNPLDFSGGGPALFTDTTDSVAERIQRACPSARVVKSLNTVTAAVMVDPARVPGDHVIFVAGDDAAAKDQTRALLGELGWPAERVVDLGDITAARAAEGYVMLWVRMMQALGTPMFNVSIAR